MVGRELQPGPVMQIAVFSARPYDRRFLDEANQRDATGQGFAFVYFDAALDVHTAALAQDCAAVCVFVNDRLDAPVLHALHALGVRAVLLRCAGFNNVDLAAAKALDLFVARVPAYSPEAVAEHALALVMTLNRQTHRAYNRVREGNFMLDGLLGRTPCMGARSASSAPARSAWPPRASSRAWAAPCWGTTRIHRRPSPAWGAGLVWMNCWRGPTSSRCIAR